MVMVVFERLDMTVSNETMRFDIDCWYGLFTSFKMEQDWNFDIVLF